MNKKKIAIFLIAIGLGSIVSGALLMIGTKKTQNQTDNNEVIIPQKTPSRNETKEDDKGTNEESPEIEDMRYEGEEVNIKNINLSNYSTNIILKEGGEYTLTGTFANSIFIETEDAITLKLNAVNINSKEGPAIANIKNNDLIINVNTNTHNKLSDGNDSSIFDGCLYSNGPLYIKGNGKLEIYGNQKDGEGITSKDNSITVSETNLKIYSNDDGLNTGGRGGTIIINSGNIYIEAGGDAIDSNKDVIINSGIINGFSGIKGINSSIDVDDNYSINGGNILLTGTDHITVPESTSKGRIICFELIDAIDKDTLIVLTDENNNIVFSLTTISKVNTILYSNNQLQNGTYYLYQGGAIENNKYSNGISIEINKNDKFTIDKNINTFIEQ